MALRDEIKKICIQPRFSAYMPDEPEKPVHITGSGSERKLRVRAGPNSIDE